MHTATSTNGNGVHAAPDETAVSRARPETVVRITLHRLLIRLADQTLAEPKSFECQDDRIFVRLCIGPRRFIRPQEARSTGHLREIETNILEALADGVHRSARDLAAAAGYRLGSHFRGILAAMRGAGLLHHDDVGYFVPPATNGVNTSLDGPPAVLPDIQANIVEALADGVHRTAREVASAAGYRLTNHFRGVLASMRRASLLHHDDAGYFLNGQAPLAADDGGESTNELDAAALQVLASVAQLDGVLTAGQIADQVGADESEMRACLARLEGEGQVRKRTPGYVLAEKGSR